jgi:flagellar protein FlbD
MIRVTRFNDSELVVNAELIEFVEATPDTVITLTNGKKLLVKESVEEVFDLVLNYRRKVGFIRTLVPGQKLSPEDEEFLHLDH